MPKLTTCLQLAFLGVLCTVSRSIGANVEFETIDDLTTNFSVVKTGNLSVNYTPAAGAGGTDGLSVTSTASTSEKSFSAVYGTAFDASVNTEFSTSLMMNAAALNATYAANEKDKLKAAVGFSTGAATNATEPKKFFDKATGSAQIVGDCELRVEHRSSKGLEFKGSLKFFNGSGGESKTEFAVAPTTVYPGPYTAYTAWYRLALKVENVGAGGQYKATFRIEDWGDGSAFVALLQEKVSTFTSTTIAADTSLYAAFTGELEKETSLSRGGYLDSYRVSVTSVVPGIPTALSAAGVGANAAAASWQAPSSGPAPLNYVVELSTAADNFAAGTLIAADGTGGQTVGILASGTSQGLLGLDPATEYVYRVRSKNSAGESDPSNVISFTTEAEYVNTPPTLDAIPNPLPVEPTAGSSTVSLTGITAGLGDDQALLVTAVSSNPSVIPNPSVTYTSPASTGALQFTPAGIEGTADITVTVNDGEALNNTVSRTFTVTVRTPPPVVLFNSASDLASEFTSTISNGNYTFDSDGGAGNPPTGGMYFVASGSSDNGALSLRNQPFRGPYPSSMKTSLLVNLKEIDDHLAGKNKGEVRLGFSNETAPIPSDTKKFFEEGGSTRRAVQVRLQAEHDLNEGKDRIIKARVSSHIGSVKTESPEAAVSGNADYFDHWLRLTMIAVPTSDTEILLSYTVEDMGANGDAVNPEVILSDEFTVTNAEFLSSPWFYGGYVLTTEKGATTKGMYVDDHFAEVLREAPAAPVALPAVQISSQNFLARWNVGDGAIPARYIVELSTVSDNFAAGTLIGENGATGQSAGIEVEGSKELRFTGLLPAGNYRYRVRGVNGVGESDYSNVIDVTLLPNGVNAPPTFDSVENQIFTIDVNTQEIPLTGISDGGETNQTVAFTVETSNSSLTPSVTVNYNSPLATGTLVITPAFGVSGSATITVTANDGGVNNATLVRQFTVTVVDPRQTMPFESIEELNDLVIYEQEADLVFGADAGLGAPATGGLYMHRTSVQTEHTAVAMRPDAFDPRATGYFTSSIFVNVAEINNVVIGKDRAEVVLGFASNLGPANKLKETLTKSRVNLGVKFKIEHQAGNPTLIEGEAFSITPGGSEGFLEQKGAKHTVADSSLANNWLKLVFQAVRKGTNQYELSYAIEDWGPEGAAFISRVVTSTAYVASNGNFATDGSVYAGFSIDGEKSWSSSFQADQFTVIANTKAPDAPAILPAFDVTSAGFTISWTAAAIGRAVDGFIVELTRTVDGFAPGTFLDVDGTLRATGIVITDVLAETLTFFGLDAFTSYSWRVRAYNEASTSAAVVPVVTRTENRTYAEWVEYYFPGNSDPEVSGPNADPERDGRFNLQEFAFGGNPILADREPLAVVGVSSLNRLTLTYKRRAGTTELTYLVEGAEELHGIWSADGISVVSVSVPDANGMETVVVQYTSAVTNQSQRFLRVSAELLE